MTGEEKALTLNHKNEDQGASLPRVARVAQPSTLDFGGKRTSKTNKTARAAKFRLMFLVVLLLMVITAMKEAAKPQRWMWMGFDREPVAGSLRESNAIIIEDRIPTDKSEFDREIRDGDISSSIANYSEAEDAAVDPAPDALPTSIANSDRDAVTREFWQLAFDGLDQSQQSTLFLLLRKVAQSNVSPPREPAQYKELIEILQEEQDSFQTVRLGEISVMKSSAEKEQRLAAFFQFDQQWKKEALPMLQRAATGDDYLPDGQSHLKQVLMDLRPRYLQSTHDLTGMGQRRDLPVWLTVWDIALNSSLNSDWANRANRLTTPVSFLQLSGQPNVYRGQPVTIIGRAKTVRRKELDKQATRLPIDAYYEMWIDPESDGDGLFCVFVAEVPAKLGLSEAEPDEHFHSIDVPVSIDGVFFKVRSYLDFGKNVSHAPVIVAKNVRLTAAVKTASGDRWGATAGVAPVFFTVIGIISIGLAVVVFRSARTGTRTVHGAAAKRVMRTLEKLGDDDEIMSAAERVAELAKQNSATNAEENVE